MINIEVRIGSERELNVEVRFGTINGNALTVDSALSTTSTNPVQNKVITAALNALQSEITRIENQAKREVIRVASYEALLEVEDPSEQAVYVTTNTGDIYIYHADTLQYERCTNNLVDGTIYVSNIDTLITMQLTADKSYAVVAIPAAESSESASSESSESSESDDESNENAEAYTLVVSSNGTRVLVCRTGWAEVITNAWSWHIYSYEGHRHMATDIDGLADAIAGKQDKNDNTLNTTNKTIVGAINELLAQMSGIIHAYTVDFQESRTTVQMRNLKGSIALKRIYADNVTTLRLSINGTLQTITLTNGVWNGTIAIPADALCVWNIARTTEGSIAEINVKYIYNS